MRLLNIRLDETPRIDLFSQGYSYIHGGAWRDPTKTSRTVEATLPCLASQLDSIAGVASLNYRLSAYPSHPTDPSSDDDPARHARHPEHVEDIVTAVAWLQQRHQFGQRYILVGHSAGATLALQLCMGNWLSKVSATQGAQTFAMPLAVVGVAGIYDLEALLESFSHIPLYRQFIEAAFGEQTADWREASPVTGRFCTAWSNAKVVVLAHSQDDELVDFLQTEKMSDQLWKEKRPGRRDVVLSLKGKHDQIWQDGTEMARAISTALRMLKEDQ